MCFIYFKQSPSPIYHTCDAKMTSREIWVWRNSTMHDSIHAYNRRRTTGIAIIWQRPCIKWVTDDATNDILQQGSTAQRLFQKNTSPIHPVTHSVAVAYASHNRKHTAHAADTGSNSTLNDSYFVRRTNLSIADSTRRRLPLHPHSAHGTMARTMAFTNVATSAGGVCCCTSA